MMKAEVKFISRGALLQVVHLQTQQRKIGPLWLLMVVLLKTLLRMEQLYM